MTASDADDPMHPLASAIARGIEQKRDLLRQAGGGLSAEEVGRHLGIPPHEIEKRRLKRQLLAVSWNGETVFPACQFDGNALLAGLPGVFEQSGDWFGWGMLAFLLAPDDMLGGLSPIDVLRRGEPKAVGLVLRLARQMSGDGFG